MAEIKRVPGKSRPQLVNGGLSLEAGKGGVRFGLKGKLSHFLQMIQLLMTFIQRSYSLGSKMLV